MKDVWTVEEATPYLERFILASSLTHNVGLGYRTSDSNLMVNLVNERLNFNNRIMAEGWMEVEGKGGSGQSCNDDDNEAGQGKDNDYYRCSMI